MSDVQDTGSHVRTERFAEIDVMKGILAILVVVGHAVQQYETSLGGIWGVVRTVIYSFHMAAFVYVSGFCSVKMMCFSAFSDVSTYLRGRAFRLLLPYVFWGVAYSLLRVFAGDCARVPYDWSKVTFFLLGYNPDGAMWFLWTLFAASAIVAVFVRNFRRGLDAVLLLGALSLLAACVRPQLDGDHLRGIRALHMFVLFLSLGLFVRMNYETAKGFLKNPVFVGFCLATFAASCCAWHFGWCAYIPWYVVSALAGTMLVLSVGLFIVAKLDMMSVGLAFLGKYAMAVYVLGEPVKVICRIAFSKIGIPVSVSFCAMLVATLAVPVLIARLLAGRSRILSALLLGENRL